MPKHDCCDSSSDSYSSDDSSFECKKCRDKRQHQHQHQHQRQHQRQHKKSEKRCEVCEKDCCRRKHNKPKPRECETKPTEEKELDICGDKKNGNYIIITIKS